MPQKIVVVDSDGCVLDSMEVKHRKAFFPALDLIWEFGELFSMAEKTWLEINLYSEFRGANRFAALSTFFDRMTLNAPSGLRDSFPDTSGLKKWIETTSVLSEASLAEACENAAGEGRDILEQSLRWTREVNRMVSAMPAPLAYAGARGALESLQPHGIPLYVVSSANRPAIETDWKEAGVSDLAVRVFGQEDGSKADVLISLAEPLSAGNGLLMVGDSPGDEHAALVSGGLFFPIIPRREAQSWLDFREAVLPRFFRDELVPTDLKPYIDQFHQALQLPPRNPSMV